MYAILKVSINRQYKCFRVTRLSRWTFSAMRASEQYRCESMGEGK